VNQENKPPVGKDNLRSLVLATGVIAGAGLKPQDRRHGPATPATPVKDSGGGTGWTVLVSSKHWLSSQLQPPE